jgi:hypothetical protein
MESLKSFKSARGIEQINFLQGKGRPFATVVDKNGRSLDIIVSEKFDKSQAPFVTYMEDKNLYVVCNCTAKEAFTL